MRPLVHIALTLFVAALFAPTLVLAQEEVDAPQPEMDGLTGGEFPWEQAYDEMLLQGRQAYNTENWEEARDAFTGAIQILPQKPAAYRNLARVYNFMGAYPEATEFYDQYLRLASGADDEEMIRQERRGTATRAGDEPWRPPADQRMSLTALERELDDGRGLTAGGGGAWGLYETLLRRDYASPEIERLREKLEKQLADEFESRLIAEDGFLPVLNGDEWMVQAQRLMSLQELARSESRLEMVQRRRLLVDAVEAFHNEDYELAADMAADAMEENDDLPYVGWYRVAALERGDRPVEALAVLDQLVESGAFAGEGLRQVEVLRAQLLVQIGEYEAAAEVYRGVFER